MIQSLEAGVEYRVTVSTIAGGDVDGMTVVGSAPSVNAFIDRKCI